MKKIMTLSVLTFTVLITAIGSKYIFNITNDEKAYSEASQERPIEHRPIATDTQNERHHQLEELKNQVFELTAQLNVLSNKQMDMQEELSLVDENTHQNDLPDATTDSSSITDHMTPEERQAKQDRLLRAQLNLLEQTHNIEQADVEWSTWAENEIQTKFQSEPIQGTQVTSTECKANTCRMEFAFNNVETRDLAMGDIPNMVPWDSQGFFHADESDPLKMVLYVSREGQELSRTE